MPAIPHHGPVCRVYRKKHKGGRPGRPKGSKDKKGRVKRGNAAAANTGTKVDRVGRDVGYTPAPGPQSSPAHHASTAHHVKGKPGRPRVQPCHKVSG